MNILLRLVSAAAVLGSAFVLSGCVTHGSRAPRVNVKEEFAVVESSTKQELTPEQMADLRQGVLKYMREEGLADGRIYYVKVTFPTDVPGEEPQWAIVRIGGQSTQTYTVIAAYPGRDDYYPYDFYRTGFSYSSYYPGYSGFSNWGYYDPFDYNYGYYNRPRPRDHNYPDKPNNPDHKPRHPDNKPDDPDKKPDQPPPAHNRWNHQPRGNDDGPRRDYPPRPSSPDRWARERNEARDAQSKQTPRPERNYTPSDRNYSPSERSYTPPARHDPSPVRNDPPPAPSYSPPPDTSSRPEPARGGIQASREQER